MPRDMLSRRAVVSTVGLSLAALAGCSTSGSSPASESATDARTASTSTASPTASLTATDEPTVEPTETPSASLELPEGVTADGIENAEALVEATKAALVENSYDITTTLFSGSSENLLRQQYRSSLEQQRHWFRFEQSSSTTEVFVESGTTYIKLTQDGETNYTQQAAEQSFEEQHRSADVVSMLGGGETLGGILRLGEYTPATMDEYNDRDVVDFEFDGIDESEIDGTVSESSGDLLVTPASVVFDAAVRMTVTADGESQAYGNSFTVNELGSVRVSRPSWVEEQFDQ
ncbi:hypothetical protein [Halolamina litorea]|uniref:Outer membrane lipoprotein-sorting protein n=1 Tax=Halolamina litorea TaxID=1515593 RepID=A0ABD6BNB0_9EURY|nr:hypothetical protein [Halolamina litorea]